jgi:hypothetical protein
VRIAIKPSGIVVGIGDKEWTTNISEIKLWKKSLNTYLDIYISGTAAGESIHLKATKEDVNGNFYSDFKYELINSFYNKYLKDTWTLTNTEGIYLVKITKNLRKLR